MEPVSATYHVFINHRGCDVKKTLASLIYNRLTEAHGLRVFLDQEELHTGDAFPPAIFGAIQSASVHIAIFSPRYAESRWCLDELCWILDKRSRKIIPVFYDVEPTDLRHIHSGRFEDAFKQHQSKGRVTVEVIEKWKTALKKASDISGIKFKSSESDHGEVLEEIVKDVLKGVKWEPLEVATYPVGLDPAVKEINDEIKKQWDLNGTAIVGIAGMAGIGKSTLAAYLYNLKRSDFSRSCFLSDIRKRDLPSLQRKLLKDLLGYDFHIEDTRQGKGIFRDRLRGLRVLIVLDDADHIEQINSLIVTDVVGSRSLILITSTDQDLLRRSSPKTVLYNVKPLQREHARELFCRHAFNQSEPSEGFEHLVEEVLKICGGLPVSIQVLGGQFHGRCEKEHWKQQLEKLSRRLPDDIMDTLKVSYEALKSEEKEIFLDLGCFFVGDEKEFAVQVLEGLGYKDVSDCFENLRQKCLVESHDDIQSEEEISIHKITMHDHIRHLARHIAREEFRVVPTPKPLRLSCSADIEQMLQMQAGADSCLIRGIRTQGQHLPDGTNYIKGVGVRLLEVEVPIGLWDMSGDLVCLRLRKFRSICFPDTISLKSLRVLELNGHGDMEQLFQRFNAPPQNLSVLDIDARGSHQRFIWGGARPMTGTHNPVKSGATTSTSSWSFDLSDSQATLDNAEQGTRAYRFNEWMRRRREIRSKSVLSRDGARPMPGTHSPVKLEATLDNAEQGFTASYFYFYRFLEWIGRSIRLPRRILLKNIPFIKSLPIDFGELKSLRQLDLSGCTNLTQLPNSFSELMHLQYLVLRDCRNLIIPVDILGNISSLEYVDFRGCRKLEYLPTGIANQKSLVFLDLIGTALKLPLKPALIPEKVQLLKIGNIPAPKPQISDSGAKAPNIRRQSRLWRPAKCLAAPFDGVKGFLELDAVNLDLDAVKASRKRQISGAKAPNIRRPYIPSSFSQELNETPKFESCEQCGSIICTHLSKKKELSSCAAGRESLQPTESLQPQLRTQNLEGTELQQYLGDLRRLKELKELNLIEFHSLNHIIWEEIAVPNMKVLVISYCPISVFTFKEHAVMGVLRDFTLSRTKITEIYIPEGVLPSLETLDLSENRELMRVEGLPSTLVRLDLQGCSRLEALISLSNLVDLKFLSVNECSQLETLNVEGLTSLEEIQAEGCRELKSIQLSQLEQLKRLMLRGTLIPKINIPEGVLPSLETLDLSENRNLIEVRDLPSTLVRLDLQGCSRLEALISLSNLVDLKVLRVNRCYKLETLNVEGLTSLEESQAEGCWELKSIQGLSQRERLKCLCISTNTDVIWNEICNFLTFMTSREELSTAFFSGKSTAVTYGDRAFCNMLWKEMQSITSKFQLKVVDADFTRNQFHTKMEDFQSYGAVLMCFLTRRDRGTICYPSGTATFSVKFEASDDGGSVDEYNMGCGYQAGDGVHLHVFVWTKECNLFRDSTGYNIDVSYRPVSWLNKTSVERGWIMMVDKNTQVWQVCKEIIIALS